MKIHDTFATFSGNFASDFYGNAQIGADLSFVFVFGYFGSHIKATKLRARAPEGLKFSGKSLNPPCRHDAILDRKKPLNAVSLLEITSFRTLHDRGVELKNHGIC